MEQITERDELGNPYLGDSRTGLDASVTDALLESVLPNDERRVSDEPPR